MSFYVYFVFWCWSGRENGNFPLSVNGIHRFWSVPHQQFHSPSLATTQIRSGREDTAEAPHERRMLFVCAMAQSRKFCIRFVIVTRFRIFFLLFFFFIAYTKYMEAPPPPPPTTEVRTTLVFCITSGLIPLLTIILWSSFVSARELDLFAHLSRQSLTSLLCLHFPRPKCQSQSTDLRGRYHGGELPRNESDPKVPPPNRVRPDRGAVRTPLLNLLKKLLFTHL